MEAGSSERKMKKIISAARSTKSNSEVLLGDEASTTGNRTTALGVLRRIFKRSGASSSVTGRHTDES